MNSRLRYDPDVRIEMPFDKFLFGGGFQQAGNFVKNHRGHDIYGISAYNNLKPILGEIWYLRFLNKQKDFCYVLLETVYYYLHHRQPIVEPTEPSSSTDGGVVLIFPFVRGDGVHRHWEETISKLS